MKSIPIKDFPLNPRQFLSWCLRYSRQRKAS